MRDIVILEDSAIDAEQAKEALKASRFAEPSSRLSDGRGGSALLDFLVHLTGELLHKIFHEHRNILHAFTQWRHMDRKDVETVVEVAAVLPVCRHLRQVAVRGGDETDIDAMTLQSTHPLKILLLEHTQKLGLNLANFVEEQRALMCHLESGELSRMSASESAALMAEEFTFQQSGGDLINKKSGNKRQEVGLRIPAEESSVAELNLSLYSEPRTSLGFCPRFLLQDVGSPCSEKVAPHGILMPLG